MSRPCKSEIYGRKRSTKTYVRLIGAESYVEQCTARAPKLKFMVVILHSVLKHAGDGSSRHVARLKLSTGTGVNQSQNVVHLVLKMPYY
jgi:hypothetical protein